MSRREDLLVKALTLLVRIGFRRIVKVAAFVIGIGFFAAAFILCTAIGWSAILPNVAAAFLGASFSGIVKQVPFPRLPDDPGQPDKEAGAGSAEPPPGAVS